VRSARDDDVTGTVLALAVLALDALVIVVVAAAFTRFVHEDDWRVETGWARRPRLARLLERVAFAGLNPLRALILWLVLGAVVTAFVAIPALFYLLGKLV
jgi:hypothetical protein